MEFFFFAMSKSYGSFVLGGLQAKIYYLEKLAENKS